MDKTIIVAVLAIFASAGFWSFVQSRLQRHDQKHDSESSFGKKLDRMERDSLRTQLLLLILLRPEEKQEILTIAEHYFRKPPNGLAGDWYMSSLFNKWIVQEGIAEPEWFKED